MITKRPLLVLLAALTAIIIITFPRVGTTSQLSITENRTALSGGELATVFKKTQTAFAQPITNLDRDRRRVFNFGDHLFNTKWVEAPSSVATLDGLGPLFNRSSCAGCHIRDGRGRPPLPHEELMLSKLIRLSVPGEDDNGGPLPHPTYGGQLQEQGILGVKSEGKTLITWQEEPGKFADGTSFSLRRPSYEFTNLAYGALGEDALFSPRVAPAVFGLALLENIREADILQNADPGDRDRDGISGRPNYVWDVEQQSKSLGRFGWKANQPNLKQQIAGAFNGDLGLTTSLFPSASCSEEQTQCQKEKMLGEQPEVSDEFLDKVTTYVSLLAVPARRNLAGDQEQLGEKLFYEAQCIACHTPRQVTGNASVHEEFNNQVIHSYTDLLLHDMGEDLADNRPDFLANGQEWRTPPLWGIGLVKNVNKHTFFLHDGRARNLTEAILWHGGEAEAAKEFVLKLSQTERDALITFLNSL
ncbi:putative thiol oxidoreductase [Xenococcus sp. PCC 7305]|uniref:di-heme oxidoreductase family protein n=1 Tax=Xenococcus sp. PCC 7305 TaxID=102125 RepID=UPI0002AC26A2|nr:di-heme oxidoredictase family protein [Xenococcus sp. PCC 7305]ELS02965.1 putative thiol oxidoreductase [Xenococcus sp. PCC 7305]